MLVDGIEEIDSPPSSDVTSYDRVRLWVMLVDGIEEIDSSPSRDVTSYQSLEEGCQKSRLGT